MNVEPEYVEETPVSQDAGPGQFEFYGQIFELHVQQLVKLKGSGGTRRFEVLVRDAHADNEFGVAPDRVVQDQHDPSANSDLDRLVVEQLVSWMARTAASGKPNRRAFRSTSAWARSRIRSSRATSPACSRITRCPPRRWASRSPRNPASSRCGRSTCSSRPARNSAATWCSTTSPSTTMRCGGWAPSALKFLKLDPKITAVAMKERVPQALVVAIAQASKVLGLSCVAKRVDTPRSARVAFGGRARLRAGFPARSAEARCCPSAAPASSPAQSDEPSPSGARPFVARAPARTFARWPAASITC